MKSNSISILTLLIFLQIGVQSQIHEIRIIGTLFDETNIPISYATIGLFQIKDTMLVAGSITDENGKFSISIKEPGNYLLTASFIGYQKKSQSLIIESGNDLDMGQITLSKMAIELSEAEIIAERIKAKEQIGKTSYFINSKMQKASSSVLDLIQFVPGIQVDLLQNIIIEGSKDIIIQVDGIVREPNYLRILDSDKIDRIEVSYKPGSAYGSEVTGMMNVVLKKKKINGVSGHLYAEIPTNKNEVYSFPSASLNIAINKLTIYSSYTGEFSSFDKKSESLRKDLTDGYRFELQKTQIMLQKNWYHKMNLGADYQINSRNQLSVYGYLNFYSYENDGTQSIDVIKSNQLVDSWDLSRDDQNENRSLFASVFYNHQFEKPENTISLDLNYYNLKATNAMVLQDIYSDSSFISSLKPRQNIFIGRLKSSFRFSPEVKLESGLHFNFQSTKDIDQTSYNYQKEMAAVYSSLEYTGSRVQIDAGLRLEHNNFGLSDELKIKKLHLLPNFKINFELSKNNYLKLSYFKLLQWPYSYQLDPKQKPVDPYTTYQGNAELTPGLSQEIAINYSSLFNNNYISIETFYAYFENNIGNLTSLSEDGVFQVRTQNMGKLSMFGIKLLGSLKPHKNLNFNPYLKLSQVRTEPNEMAIQSGITKKKEYAFETGFSLAVLLKHEFSISANLQYNKSRILIDRSFYEDALYIFGIDKTISEKLKMGFTCAIPFKRNFLSTSYKGSSILIGEQMSEWVQMSNFPICFKLKYSFDSGKKSERKNRPAEFQGEPRRKGL